MAIFSQLERLDWEGKRVFALMTHEGSGHGSSERDLKQYCPGADVFRGQAQIAAWDKKVLA